MTTNMTTKLTPQTESALEGQVSEEFQKQFAEMVRSRRATRVFLDEKLDPAKVEEFLSLVMEAPSAFNLQDRSIVVIEDPQVRAEVSTAANNQPQVASVPLLLAFLAEPSGWERTLPKLAQQNTESGFWTEEIAAAKQKGVTGFQTQRREAGLEREFALRNAMIAATYAILSAPAFGWASSPMTGFDEAALKKAIGAEGTDIVVALLLAVGKPGEQPQHPGRFATVDRVYRDKYPS